MIMNQESIGHYLVEENDQLYELYQGFRVADEFEEDQGCICRVPNNSYIQGTHIQKQAHQIKALPKRISNNSFKIPLTIFKKVMAIESMSEKQISIIQAITRKKNMGSFPKLLFLAEKWGLKIRVAEKWEHQWKETLQQIQPKQDQYKLQFRAICNRMTQALECKNWKKAIKIYWGTQVRHKKKQQTSMKEVEVFRKNMRL